MSISRTSFIALALVAVAVAPASAGARTYVTGVGKDYKIGYKPRAFTAGSGVGGGVLKLDRMRWSSWRTKTAGGRGRLTYNICDPTCADGNLRHKRVRVRLFRPRRNCRVYADGKFVTVRKPLFTKIELRSPGEPVFESITAETQSCQAAQSNSAIRAAAIAAPSVSTGR